VYEPKKKSVIIKTNKGSDNIILLSLIKKGRKIAADKSGVKLGG